MKTLRITYIWLFLIMSWTSCCAQTTLRIARIENIPDQFVGGEILKVVYSRLNIAIELVDMPAMRAIVESSRGTLDGEVHRNIHVLEQYPSLVIVRPAINSIEPSVFSKNFDFTVQGWNSIKDYNIGIVRGVGTSEDGTKGMQKVQATTSLGQLMQMLAGDRIDIAVSDSFSGLVVVKELGLEQKIKILAPPLQKVEIYHYLHESHRDLVPKVERVLREMQSSGELSLLRKQIIERYLTRVGSVRQAQ